MPMKNTILIILFLFTTKIMAQVSVNSSVSSRWLKDSESVDQQQTGVYITLKAKIGGGYEIVSFVGTGRNFAVNWDQLYNYNNPQGLMAPENLAMRQLYIKKQYHNGVEAQAGALPPMNGILAHAGMNKNGWVDGARIKIPTRLGFASITAGSIHDTENPNVFTRDRQLNYFDIFISNELYENLMLEYGLDITDGTLFTRGALKYTIPMISDRVISFMVEELNSLESDKSFQVNFNTEFKTPIKKIFNKELKNTSLTLGVNYGYITPNFHPQRRNLESFVFLYDEGHQVNAYAQLKTGQTTWFVNYRHNSNIRFAVGVKANINWKSKKQKKKKKAKR
jgi:hypothetical protein